MKKLFFIFSGFLTISFLYAAQPKKPDYIYNENRVFFDAKVCFNNQNYGKSLKLIDDAKKKRKQKIDWEVYTLLNSLKPAEVKVAGDNLNDIIPILNERQDYDALEIIERYSKIPGLEKFDYSSSELINYIKTRIPFPEADYLAGKIYQLEGEYDVSEKLFLKAYENSDILDVIDEKYDILYSLADLSKMKDNLDDYEKYLILVIGQDAAFKDKALINAMKNTIESTKNDCLEKFFLMYRAENFRLLNAYFYLSDYYLTKNENERALEMVSLGVLTGFTKIFNIIKDRNPEFEYKELSSLLEELKEHPDLVEWGKDNNIWKGFNGFANEAFKNQCNIFAINLYSVLKDFSPEEYWRKDADMQLKYITCQDLN